MQSEEKKSSSLTAGKFSLFTSRYSLFLVIALLAILIRLPQLGERPMHTDEAINAYLTGELLEGETYQYDPQDRHGPALVAETLPVVRLFGAKQFASLTEFQLRLVPVLTGALTVLLFGAGVEMFGFTACIMAALLFALAPLPVYYSRYFIHETLFVAATLGLMLSGWRALIKKSVLSAGLAGGCAALMLACKETAVIHFFAFAVALLVARFGAPIFSSTRTCEDKKITLSEPSARILKIFLIALLVFITTTILLFTWFGKNWSGLSDLFRAIPHLASRAGGEGHEKPFWYYAGLLSGGWSGVAIIGLAALGFVRSLKSNRGRWLAVYAGVTMFIYAAIPYKTPWLALNFWLPIALLSGLIIESCWFAFPKISSRASLLALMVLLFLVIGHDTKLRVFLNPADERNPYAYAHTGEDLLRLAPRLHELASQRNNPNPRIAVIAADAWPLPWYLRKFPKVGFWQPGQDAGDADFFITSTDASDKLVSRLTDYRPEYFGVRPGVLIILWVPVAP